MLKKLFFPEEKDICPNCGKACAITDILCPRCGKNLDELFEQLPDPEASSFTLPKWLTLPVETNTSRSWRAINSTFLIIAISSPWEAVYSDIIMGGSPPYYTIIGLRVFSYTIPNDLPSLFQFDCLACMSMGLIAIGYVGLILFTILNFVQANLHDKRYDRSISHMSRGCLFVSGLMFLQLVIPMYQSFVTWGYWLACVGLSSLYLEIREWLSRKSSFEVSLLNAA